MNVYPTRAARVELLRGLGRSAFRTGVVLIFFGPLVLVVWLSLKLVVYSVVWAVSVIVLAVELVYLTLASRRRPAS
jgi:hypothetical protein